MQRYWEAVQMTWYEERQRHRNEELFCNRPYSQSFSRVRAESAPVYYSLSMIPTALGLPRSWMIICIMPSPNLLLQIEANMAENHSFQFPAIISQTVLFSTINFLSICPAWMMLSIIWKLHFATSLILITFQDIHKPKSIFPWKMSKEVCNVKVLHLYWSELG